MKLTLDEWAIKFRGKAPPITELSRWQDDSAVRNAIRQSSKNSCYGHLLSRRLRQREKAKIGIDNAAPDPKDPRQVIHELRRKWIGVIWGLVSSTVSRGRAPGAAGCSEVTAEGFGHEIIEG
jgi:hypothetical protein